MELRVVPDPLIFPSYQRTFGSAPGQTHTPSSLWFNVADLDDNLRRVVDRVDSLRQLIQMRLLTVDEARAKLGP